MLKLRSRNSSIIISYIELRRLIGLLGMLLPFICVLGGAYFADLPVQRSISYYYHTNMRDFFVGLMFCVSLFLITYKGYEMIDNIVTTSIGIAGLFIPVFPCFLEGGTIQEIGIFQFTPRLSNILHLVFASLFFLLLAINSIFLFTLGGKDKMAFTKNKGTRNVIYITCGVIMLASMASIAVLSLVLSDEVVAQYRIVLLFETIMLFSFGVSWLIKGKTLFRD